MTELTGDPVGGADDGEGDSRPVVGRILVVCTGNICRSPYIERRLADLLADTDAVVSSAGTRALIGAPIEPGSAQLLEAAGGSTADFASRQITPAMLAEADLVIAATQMHRAESVRVNPRVLRRTFTLGELADLLRDADLVAEAADTDPDAALGEAPHGDRAAPSWALPGPARGGIGHPGPLPAGSGGLRRHGERDREGPLVVGPALRPPTV